MPKLELITTPKETLVELAVIAEQALSPRVVFGPNPELMLTSAYQERGNALVVIKNTLNRITHVELDPMGKPRSPFAPADLPPNQPVPVPVDEFVLSEIKTAPLGEYIIVFGPSGCITTPMRCEVCIYCSVREAWIDHANDRFTDGGGVATHWMPLPPIK